ncbi:MAG TPA: glycoside hydrolase family 3 C-terminal domain-containing protein [Acidimicrobiales bacterium]|nr:glycoside hydrolase family 3 C-terminal domain-containing protein [Acidimicrobiales bacterium]
MPSGDPDTPADDIEALVADPVLVALAAERRPTTPPPDVWGRLAGGAGQGTGAGGHGPAAAPGPAGRADPVAVEARARALLDEMSQHERLHLLSGDTPLVRGLVAMARRYNETPYVAGEVARLGVPGIRFSDGPRGVVVGQATEFPVAMARGATFDPALEARVGDAIGVECRVLGANLFAGVCVNLLRNPAWGRAQETYGEDSHLLGEMGAAQITGVQRHVMACVKHFAGYSLEDHRLRLDVRIDEDDLRDLYLPHFRRCVDAGVAAVMTAYNRVNGVRCGHHDHLLGEILKGEWGFDGFVMSDFVLGIRSARALAAGLDLEMPFRWRFKRLDRRLRRGRVTAARVEDAALRLLCQQVRFAAGGGEPDRYRPDAVAGDAHRALAREVAERSIVLLRNETVRRGPATGRPTLPLDPDDVRTLALFGRLAEVPVTGDRGSSQVRPPAVVTFRDGLMAAGERHVIDVTHHRGDDLQAAGLAAGGADVAVVVVGTSHRDEGEKLPRQGGDRVRLTLHPDDEALVRTVAAANPRTVVVLVGGGAIVTESWRGQVGAMVMAWYPGMEGGHAVARVLFGEVNPGGRLPCTWPQAAEQAPPVTRGARTVRYGPLHGYRLMEATGRVPAFPFGFGLSYTSFEIGRLVARRGYDGGVTLTVPVVNTGTLPGDEVVQIYLDEALGSDPRPLRTLRAFRRVTVAPGDMVNVRFDFDPDELARTRAVHAGAVRLHVGRDADPAGHRTIEA